MKLLADVGYCLPGVGWIGLGGWLMYQHDLLYGLTFLIAAAAYLTTLSIISRKVQA